jgi:glycerol uptake facilitator-like aquaporin
MAIFRGFPWKKVPGYILGQIIGAWAGAMLVFANYFHAIDIFEGQKGERTLKTGGLFATYAVCLVRGRCINFLIHFLSSTTCLLQTVSLTR